MILNSAAADITYTPEFSGIPASYLTMSIMAAGLDPTEVALPGAKVEREFREAGEKPKAWSTIWAAGQGCGSVNDVLSTADLVVRLKAEYDAARAQSARGEKNHRFLLLSNAKRVESRDHAGRVWS